YLGLNRIPPPAYRKPWSWSKVPDRRSSQVPSPPQPKDKYRPSVQFTTVNQTRRPAESGSASQNPMFTKLVEGSKKALAEERYDEAADCLTRALNYVSDDRQRYDIKQQLSYIYNLKGEKLLPELQRRKRNGEPYIALI